MKFIVSPRQKKNTRDTNTNAAFFIILISTFAIKIAKLLLKYLNECHFHHLHEERYARHFGFIFRRSLLRKVFTIFEIALTTRDRITSY